MARRKRWIGILVAFLASALAGLAPAGAAEVTSLAGQWRFALDRDDAGTSQKWFSHDLPQTINLPGALQSQGFGDDIGPDTQWTANVNDRSWFTSPKYAKYRQPGNIKVPFWLQPDKHYVGPAWYQRDIEIPAAWAGRRVILTLERPHWETRVWLDERAVGSNDSLCTAHVYDLGLDIPPGKHRLTIRVDNRLIVDVGVWAHSVSDHTQGNWNGIVGRIELSIASPVWIDDAQVYPDLTNRSARLKVRIGNATGKPGSGTLAINSTTIPVTWNEKSGSAEADVPLPAGAQPWDEFNPALQHLTLRLTGGGADDQRTVTFGLRQIATHGRDFLLNGHSLFFRGTLECCIFPRTGYPPTDIDSWKRIITICKSYGLNHIRFHSWCPPEAAFLAADEMGFYYSVEIAAWTRVGSGAPIDRWLYTEADRILRAYGNHPSFLLMPYGNEPAGGKERDQYLTDWVDHWKPHDGRRLYTSASGWPALPDNQYDVIPAPRGPGGWLGKDYRDRISKIAVPVIVHEMGQWCVYPNFDEISKYTGPLKPHNFEIFRDSLAEHGMADQAHAFLIASGKLQTLCYKEEIEAALRTPGIGGFQLLDLHDFPGQGTALVGLLDAFWDSKGYITPEQFRRFCNTTVPLARVTRRVWTTGDTLTADVEVAHFGPTPLAGAVAAWKLATDDGNPVAAGELPAKDLPIASGTQLGQIRVDLANLAAPHKYTLTVGVKGTPFENDWDIWLYPTQVDTAAPPDVLLATAFDEQAISRLNDGGTVLLLPLTHLSPDNPKGSFTPIFWNRQWFPKQACQTLGLLCDPKHPALAEFPTDFHSNWQWEDLATASRAIDIDALPRDLRPIVQVIDDWNTNRRLALIFECRLGKGRLLICSADLTNRLDQRPAARQLLHSLLSYARTDQFNPSIIATADQIQALMTVPVQADPPLHEATIQTPRFRLFISAENGSYRLQDLAGGVTWTSNFQRPRFGEVQLKTDAKLRTLDLAACELRQGPGSIEATFHVIPEDASKWVRVRFTATRDGSALAIAYDAAPDFPIERIRLLDHSLSIRSAEHGYALLPTREGLLIPADSGKAFSHTFDTYAYEGCHMMMAGMVKSGAAMLVTWDDPYVAAEVDSVLAPPSPDHAQTLALSLALRKSARSFTLWPAGKGDFITLGQLYRQLAAERGLLVPWDIKLKQNPERAKLLGASNVKLWSALTRKMDEQSQHEESVHVNWTFDEAAQVAEHLKNDLKMDRVLFTVGGWTHRGYDNQHPDVLPAAPECGGNDKLAECSRRVMALGYAFCLHDNYQDIYRDSPSWDESFIARTPTGELVKGGRWAGGRAYITCSRKALELAQRPQNLSAVKALTGANAYFIDTTFAAGLQECFSPQHPLTRGDDMHWKQALSDYARQQFGIFGSECGREWAIPHADFFEGLTGVAGAYYHDKNLLASTGGIVVPLFEVVYRDCIAMYGKYGYDYANAAEYVLHHVSIARPLNYHSVPTHLYWKADPSSPRRPLPAGSYSRADHGWGEGMHPADAFMKNTHEILSPLNQITAKMQLASCELLSADGKARRTVFGQGKDAVTIIVNAGERPYTRTAPAGGGGGGGDVVLPPMGFVVDSPTFAAFCATRWNGVDYQTPALFTLRATDGKPIAESTAVRVFHGFGPPDINLGGVTRKIDREAVVSVP